ncbi:MAG: MFS transporter [Actinomycetota bacterium]|nr:MFS transporter [Actinomycetota bacterium]
MSEVVEQRTRSLDAFRAVLHNPNLRRLQLAWVGSNLGTWGYGVALAVYAYNHGGATAVGVVALARFIPAAIAAPFMGTLGDRYPRRLVMVLSDMGRVVVVGFAALAVFAHASPIVIYVLAAIGVVISTAFRPAQAAIISSLATTPEELTASNVVSSSIEALGIFVGPAFGGLFLVIGGPTKGPGVVFAVASATFLWSALLILRIRVVEGGARTRTTDEGAAEHPSFLKHLNEGVMTVVKEPAPRLLVSLFGAQTLIAGALNVLEVVIAFELLRRGPGWVGILSAAFGVGGLLGAALAGALVGRGRLAIDFGVGILLWGLPLILIGVWPHPAVAIGTMVLMGLGNTLVDVSGMTLLQRSVPDEVLARVFGVLETVFLATIALGAIITPAIVHGLHTRTALIVIGSFLPIVIALTWRHLTALDRSARAPERELALLNGIPFFAALPRPVLEHLAGRLMPFKIPARTHVFDQGDSGDRFYVVANGVVDIMKDGALVTQIAPGGYFGEIALLHDVPRTAGAVAETDTELFALEGEDFVAAVTGYAPSHEAVEMVVRSYGLGLGF